MIDRPQILSMAVTSRCNLRCVMCDHGLRNIPKEDFDEALLGNIGDFIDAAIMVDLTGLGEPLLSAFFWRVIDKYQIGPETRDEDYVLTFNTNGVLLTNDRAERILNSRVSKIRVSIDASDAETFYKIRGTDLNQILDNVRWMISRRNELDRSRPRIGIEMTVMKDTFHKTRAMIDLTKEIGADFIEIWSLNALREDTKAEWIVERDGWNFVYAEQEISFLSPASVNEHVRSLRRYADRKGVAILMFLEGVNYESPNFHEQAGTTLLQRRPQFGCDLPWIEARIVPNGEVRTCCWQTGSIGNIKDHTLDEIWSGAEMQELRQGILDGKIPRVCGGSACSYVKGRSADEYDIQKERVVA